MSYRKLTVEGQAFEYSIGKTHTKIRYVGAFKNEDVGQKYQNGVCHCGYRGCDYAIPLNLQVHPRDIILFIKEKNLKPVVKKKEK